MKSLFKCVAAMACLFGVFAAAAQAADDYPAVPYYRSASMTAKGGAQTWTAKVAGDQSSTRAMEVQQALSRHLQAVMRKDLVLEASIKSKPDAVFEVKLELAETATPILFPKGIETFVVGKSCDYNTTMILTGTAEAIAKLKEKDSAERRMLDAKLVEFGQWAHWLPLKHMNRTEATVEIIEETKTSITFDVMFDPVLVQRQQKAIQLSVKEQQKPDAIPLPQSKI